MKFLRLIQRKSLPSIFLDLLIVHASMWVAIQVSILWLIKTSGADTQELLALATAYYGTFSWALAPLFPIVFAVNGFYSWVPYYEGSQRLWMVARGVGLSLLIFLTANYMFFRNMLVDRSALLAFSAVLMVTMLLRRGLKKALLRYFGPRAAAAPVDAKETVLVIGGAGYIGSLLLRKLLAEGYRVRVLDNLTYGDGAIAELKTNPDFELMMGDCRNIRSVVSAMKGVSSLVHLAAIVGDPACEQDQKSALEINYAATRVLIEIAKGYHVKRFVFASSCSVYGATEKLSDELSDTSPISLYAQTKIDSEKVLLQSTTADFHPTVLRFATVFGLSYRPRFDLVVNLLTAKAYQDHTITIFNGQQWRPFLHAADAAQSVVEVLKAPAAAVSGEIFNIGDSRLNYTLDDIARLVQDQIPNTTVEHVDNNDRRNYRVSFAKAESRLNFRSSITVEQGIAELKGALEAGSITDYHEIKYSNLLFLRATGTPTNMEGLDEQIMTALSQPTLSATS